MHRAAPPFPFPPTKSRANNHHFINRRPVLASNRRSKNMAKSLASCLAFLVLMPQLAFGTNYGFSRSTGGQAKATADARVLMTGASDQDIPADVTSDVLAAQSATASASQ